MEIVLACNNNWGLGGQGNFLERAARGLHQAGAHGLTVFCSGTTAAAAELTIVPQGYSWASQRLMATPILRRRRDLATLWGDEYFDRRVARGLVQDTKNLDLFVGVAGQCALSLGAAKQRGAAAWLYCLNTYLPFMQAQIAQECRVLGERAIATMHPHMLSRFATEWAIADRILVNSQVARDTFVAAGVAPERLAAILPVVDCQRFRPAPRQEDGVFRVLFLGTLDPRKGAHYLVPALVEAAIPGWELLLVGGVSTRTMRLWLERTLAEHPQVRQELWDVRRIDPPMLFGRCDVLVMPSVEDGFGVVALEGMASGLPVIVTEHCGAADLIRQGENGFVVPPRDSGAIAQVLRALAADPQGRRQIGQRARSTAEQHTQSRYDRDMALLLQGVGA